MHINSVPHYERWWRRGGGLIQAAARCINGGKRGFCRPDPSRKHGIKKTSASLVPGLGITTKRPPWTPDGSVGMDHTKAVVRKIWIPTNCNPDCNYEELLIRPKGSKHCELIASSGGEF